MVVTENIQNDVSTHYSNEFYSDETNSKRIVDMSKEENTHPSYFLRLRDLELLVDKFKPADKQIEDLEALDYGCGTGRPTRHLKQIGMKKIVGCDINESLIEICRQLDPKGRYVHLKSPEKCLNGRILPFEDRKFDFVMSCQVVVEIASKQTLEDMFNETSRVLKPGGLYFLMKSPKEIYSSEYKWKFFEQNFPENKEITSGSPIRFGFLGVELKGFYWSEPDVIELCERAGLAYVDTHEVLARDEPGGVQWIDEKRIPIHIVLVFRKQL